jgi:G3E family GTPase
VVLLNKIDLVSPEALAQIEARIRMINPYAKLHRTQRSEIALDAILDRGAFDLKRILDIEPDFLESDHAHEHDSEIGSVSAVIEGTVDVEKFQTWIHGLLATQGQSILRSKGILSVADAKQRFVFQGVHMLADSAWGKAWQPQEARVSRMVFIGRNLDEAALKSGFAACAA